MLNFKKHSCAIVLLLSLILSGNLLAEIVPSGGILINADNHSKVMGLEQVKENGQIIYNLIQFDQEYNIWDIEDAAQISGWSERAIAELKRSANGSVQTHTVSGTIGIGSGCNSTAGGFCMSFPFEIPVNKRPKIKQVRRIRKDLQRMIDFMVSAANKGEKSFISNSYFRLLEVTY